MLGYELISKKRLDELHEHYLNIRESEVNSKIKRLAENVEQTVFQSLSKRIEMLEKLEECLDENENDIFDGLSAIEKRLTALEKLIKANISKEAEKPKPGKKAPVMPTSPPESQEVKARRILAQLEAEGSPIFADELGKHLGITTDKAAIVLKTKLGYVKGRRVWIEGHRRQPWQKSVAEQPNEPKKDAEIEQKTHAAQSST